MQRLRVTGAIAIARLRRWRLPSGHDGMRRFRSPFVLLLLLTLLYWASLTWPVGWTLYLAYPLAAMFAWRLAWHLCLFGATEYGGALTAVDRLQQARARFFRARVVLVPVAILSIYLFWP